MFKCFLSLTLLVSASAFAGPADSNIEYSRDEHYVYQKMPVALTWDDEQMATLRVARARLVRQLTAMLPFNPRVGKGDDLISDAQGASTVFERALDDTIAFLQRNYATIASAGYHNYNLFPTGFMLYTGAAVGGARAFLLGGSVLAGMNVIPRRVYRTNVDTRVTDVYTDWEGAIFVWPNAYIGDNSDPKMAGKITTPIGVGLIFGALAKPEDFSGMVFGVSATRAPAFLSGLGLNWKFSELKNFSKAGAINNMFATVSLVGGAIATANPNPSLSISYIIDAKSFFHGGADLMQSIGAAVGLSKPAAPLQNPPATQPLEKEKMTD